MKPIDPRPGQTGERLHQIREHRNMSQAQLAKAISVTVGTVQNYEHGRTAPTTDRLEQMAPALQCQVADILMPPGSPPPRYRRPRYEWLVGAITGLQSIDGWLAWLF